MTWAFRIAWAVLPFTLGPLLADALSSTDDTFRVTAAVVVWVVWAVTLAASLVERSVTLTIIRTAAPAAVAAGVWAVLVDDVDAWKVALGLATALLAAVLALSAPVGDAFVNGSAYGPERRMALRATISALVLAPVAWAVCVLGVVAGPLLLADGQVVAGIVWVALGIPFAWLAGRALHGLSRRWIVFVPAGVVVHDPLVMTDPVLFPRRAVTRFGPAEEGDRSLDLSGGAPGLALHLEVDVPQSVGLRRGRDRTENVETAAVLVTPVRPGAVLAEAKERRISVG